MQRKVKVFLMVFYLFTLKCQLEKSICRSMFFYTCAYLSARKFQCSNYLIRNEWMIEWMNEWMNEWTNFYIFQHKTLRHCSKYRARKGRLHKTTKDIFNHLWIQTDPFQRSLSLRYIRPKKQKQYEDDEIIASFYTGD